MISKDFYNELDEMVKTGIDMAADGATMLNKAHPQIPLLYCNKFVVDWINERKVS